MIGASAVAGAAGSAGSAGASAVSGFVSGLIFGGFNPSYSKLHRRRMRYIQQKYAHAYGDSSATDPNSAIHAVDPSSKLKMTPDGFKPANPFPDERAFEEALVMNFHPTPGHQGKFCGSHAMTSLGVIIQYQINRRSRIYVPGVVSAGKPNDYVNMFLEEMKNWLRTQMALDTLSADELRKRLLYIKNLKNDRYHWCFPPESITDAKLHDVIDFVHERVVDAYDLTVREEKNKSMQTLFKELNDHTINAFEFGKNFLAYIIYVSKVAGADLLSSKVFKGRTMETGKLHHLLVKATDPVLKLYAQDMKLTDQRLELAAELAASEVKERNRLRSGTQAKALTNGEGVAAAASDISPFIVDEGSYTTYSLSETLYSFPITDRSGTTWSVSKKYSEFQQLHEIISDIYYGRDGIDTLVLPPKFPNFGIPNAASQNDRCKGLQKYLTDVLDGAVDADMRCRMAIADFISVKQLDLGTKTRCRSAENIPNYFVNLKAKFSSSLVSTMPGCPRNATEDEKQMFELREQWGHDGVFKILQAYGYLQRMATILGWTLELNHFFISMFGNMIAFSKLPIRELLVTQKDVMNSFMSIATELYETACALNARNKYTWHKNLHISELELTRTRFHINSAVSTISRIETEHLDKDVQMRRLMDVASRFNPFLSKVGLNLPSIQRELGLPVREVLPERDSDESAMNPFRIRPSSHIEELLPDEGAASRFLDSESEGEDDGDGGEFLDVATTSAAERTLTNCNEISMNSSSCAVNNGPIPCNAIARIVDEGDVSDPSTVCVVC